MNIIEGLVENYLPLLNFAEVKKAIREECLKRCEKKTVKFFIIQNANNSYYFSGLEYSSALKVYIEESLQFKKDNYNIDVEVINSYKKCDCLIILIDKANQNTMNDKLIEVIENDVKKDYIIIYFDSLVNNVEEIGILINIIYNNRDSLIRELKYIGINSREIMIKSHFI